MKKYCGVVLKTAYDRMGETAGIDILGKSMLDWVKLALSDVPVAVADYDATVEIPALVRPFVAPDCDYVVVLFSDTPLITRKTVVSAVEEAYNSGRAVVKMTRGYVFSSSFALNADKIYSNDTIYFDEEDFITAFNFKQIGLITDVLKNRILDFHMEQGVHFADLTGTVIGCDVSIEGGAKIGYGNVLLGKTRISSGAIIGNGNRLTDCIVSGGAVLNDTVATRVLIGKDATVGPFVVLNDNAVIGDGATIGSFVELSGVEIPSGAEIFSSALAMRKIEKQEQIDASTLPSQSDERDETLNVDEPVEKNTTEQVDECVETEKNNDEIEVAKNAESEDTASQQEEIPDKSNDGVENNNDSDDGIVDVELYEGEIEQVNPDKIEIKYDYYDEIDADDIE